MIKNLLTSILLAGSAMLYGQNSSENPKKISELYGKQGEKIVYKNYSQIPWNQLTDTNKINLNGLEEVLVKPEIKNEEGFKDSVFAEAKTLGYDKEKIKNLSVKEAVSLSVDIVASRYKYDYVERDKHLKDTFCLHDVHRNNDFYFFRKLGVCVDYSKSFIEVFNLIKKENKNLINLYTTKREGEEHAWNQLIILTKDSLFLSDIDPTSYDNSHLKELGLDLEYLDYKTEPKIATLSKLKDNSLNYFLYKELLNQVDLSGLKIASAENYFNSNREYYQLFWKKIRIEDKLKENYMVQKILQSINEYESPSIKGESDSLSLEYKNIEKKIDSLTTKLNEKAKKNYEFQRYGALREMFESAFATEDTAILEDATNYFSECSDEDYILRKSMYYIYKENKNKGKAKELKKKLKEECIQEDWCNTKKKFEMYEIRVFLDYHF